MPFDVQVTLEGGQTGVIKGIPDGTTPDAVHQVAQQQFQQPITQMEALSPSLAGQVADKVGRVAGVAASGLAHGVAGLGNLAEIPVRQVAKSMFGEEAAPAATELIMGRQHRVMKSLDDNLAKPETTGEKYLYSGAEGVGGALPTLGASSGLTVTDKIISALRQLGVGAAGGLGAQAGENAFPDHPMLGRIVGSLFGGVSASALDKVATEVAARVAPTSAARRQIVDLITKNVSPDRLDESAATMRNVAGDNAVNLTGAQATATPTALDELQTVLAQHPEGKQTQEILRAQPGQVSLLASQMEGSGGGVASNRGDVSRAAQEGADSYIQGLKAKARLAFQNAADGAQDFAQSDVRTLDKQLETYAKAHPSVESLQTMVTDLRGRLKNPDSAGPTITEGLAVNPTTKVLEPVKRSTAATDTYLANPLQVKEGIMDAFGKYQSQGINVNGAQAVDAFHTNNLRDIINGLYEQGDGALSRANKAFSDVYATQVDPTRASIVGQVAGRQGFIDDVATPEGKLFSLLGKGTTNPAASDITRLGRALNKAGDKEVVPNIVSTYIDHTVKNISDAGAPGLDYAGKINQAFFGSEAKRQGLRDMVKVSAEARGFGEDGIRDAINGVDKYAQIFKMASKVPSNVGGVSAADIKEAAGSTPSGELLAIGSRYMPLRLLRTINEGKADQAMAFMDKLITTPEGMELLAKMGREKGLSQGWANLLSTGFATFGASTNNTPTVSTNTSPE